MQIQPTPEALSRVSKTGVLDEPSAKTESFIVQNIHPGPHHVSDIRLNFAPYEVLDLTWEDPRYIKASNDLRKSLRNGNLRQITQEYWDAIQAQTSAREREQIVAVQNARRQRNFNIDGKTFEADIVNLNADSGKVNGETVSASGHANDPLTYATAFERASQIEAASGRVLDAAEFGRRADSNPRYFNSLLQGQSFDNSFPNGVYSGDPNRGRATVATSPTNISGGTGTAQFNMTNYNRDQMMAGGAEAGIASYQHQVDDAFMFDDDGGIAEEIDLARDDDGGSSLRRI